MPRKLRNVTITLEEEVARWARVEAAREDTSVSQMLAGILRAQMKKSREYDTAMRRALERKPFLKSDGRYLTRQEAHERASFR